MQASVHPCDISRRRMLTGGALFLPGLLAACTDGDVASGAAAGREALLPVDAPVLLPLAP